MRTSRHSTQPSGSEQLICFPGESRASRHPEQESKKDRMTTAGSGRKLSACCKSASPLGSCLRILLASEMWASMEYSLKWKGAGTKSRWSIYRLVPSTRRNSDTGIGYSDTWDTPRVVQRPGSAATVRSRAASVCYPSLVGSLDIE